MEVYPSEKRVSHRYPLKATMRLRVRKSGQTEWSVESDNLSETGTFFSTDAPLVIGSAVEILLVMPQEISGKPTTEWRCAVHVVRFQPGDTAGGELGVGVEFDYYEILRSKAPIPPKAA